MNTRRSLRVGLCQFTTPLSLQKRVPLPHVTYSISQPNPGIKTLRPHSIRFPLTNLAYIAKITSNDSSMTDI